MTSAQTATTFALTLPAITAGCIAGNVSTCSHVAMGIKTKGMSGKPIATEAPYGYVKDSDNKDFWLIDEEAADRSRENQKERLQYLAAGTAGTATPQGARYGTVTDRAAG